MEPQVDTTASKEAVTETQLALLYQGDTAYFGDLGRGLMNINNNTAVNPLHALQDHSLQPIQVSSHPLLLDSYNKPQKKGLIPPEIKEIWAISLIWMGTNKYNKNDAQANSTKRAPGSFDGTNPRSF
eukprot:jgi/Psemu1/5212/gm1.5212_g